MRADQGEGRQVVSCGAQSGGMGRRVTMEALGKVSESIERRRGWGEGCAKVAKTLRWKFLKERGFGS